MVAELDLASVQLIRSLSGSKVLALLCTWLEPVTSSIVKSLSPPTPTGSALTGGVVDFIMFDRAGLSLVRGAAS